LSIEVSVIIPAREEEYLQWTIDDLITKAEGSIEVITVLDGYWPDPPLRNYNNLHIIHNSEPGGMRAAINAGARIAKGKYLLKCDAHCIFDQSYDTKLKKDCEPNWTVVPRRYGLTRKEWKPNKELYEFQYITSPDDQNYPFKGANWPEYGARVDGDRIVDLMTTQGSCWFMHKDRFWELDGLDEENYGWMGREAQEICLKTWLSGGRFVLNRGTWYAHLKRSTRPYNKKSAWFEKSKNFVIDFWTNDKWPKQTRKFKSLIKQFAPIPSWHEKESFLTNRYIQEKYKLGSAREYPAKIKGMNRLEFAKMLKRLGFKIGCEVGVEEGRFSKLMIDTIPDLKLYLVDPYGNYPGVRKIYRNHKKNKEICIKNMQGFNVEFIEMQSGDAVRKIPDDTLDFVYIDANHRYDYVMMDIILWTPKVKKGGIISGHDYYAHRRTGCEVRLAVDDYVKAHDIVPWFLTDTREEVRKHRGDNRISWFWVKK